MPIKDAKGDIKARIFFIAYTADTAGRQTSDRSCLALTVDQAQHQCGYT